MQSFMFMFFAFVIFGSAFSFMVHRYEVKKRARKTRRNSTFKKHTGLKKASTVQQSFQGRLWRAKSLGT
jgi:hypothetical protein